VGGEGGKSVSMSVSVSVSVFVSVSVSVSVPILNRKPILQMGLAFWCAY